MCLVGGFVAGGLDADADKAAAYANIVGAVVVQVQNMKCLFWHFLMHQLFI